MFTFSEEERQQLNKELQELEAIEFLDPDPKDSMIMKLLFLHDRYRDALKEILKLRVGGPSRVPLIRDMENIAMDALQGPTITRAIKLEKPPGSKAKKPISPEKAAFNETGKWFTNFYMCHPCNISWSSEWANTVDDDCPVCNMNYSPYDSKTIRFVE